MDHRQEETRGEGRPESSKPLACISCRRKKVKCRPGPQGIIPCALCSRLGEGCDVPKFDDRRRAHSRKITHDLQVDNARLKAENQRLRAELEEHWSTCLGATSSAGDASITNDLDSAGIDGAFMMQEVSLTSPDLSSSSPANSDNMIIRLCGGKRQLNSDRMGRLRFFGPTSSLHLMESVTSSVLLRESKGAHSMPRATWQDDFPLEVQNQLLDLYWTYQHQVLPCIHKEAFLRDMNNGDTKYCSTLLIYCILTRAAAISNQPGLQALALADDADDDAPYLVRKCVQLTETELDNPGITTAQSLQLLSEMHCAISHDTKGWMYAGGAGRLAYELGLHRDSCNFDTNLSDLDQQVRRVVFWSCFNLDREWALYLGRPQFLKLEDIDAKRPGEGCAEVPLEVSLSAAWTSLLEIIGQICDLLNGVHTPQHKMETLDKSLQAWKAGLGTDFQESAVWTPPIFILHMQYAAAVILLHRPLALFGKEPAFRSSASEVSRRVCVTHACTVASYIRQYSDQHGSVMTMSWIALHIVATAATTLVANVAERRGDADWAQQLDGIRTCHGALSELEKSHVVTRRVRKVIQQAIRLLNLDATINLGGSAWQASSASLPTPVSLMSLGDWRTTGPETAQFPLLDLLPPSGQFDMLNSFESYFS